MPCQIIYLKKVLDQFSIQDGKSISTLLESEIDNPSWPSEDQVDRKTMKWYQSIMRSFIRLAIYNKPDIAFSVGV